VAPQTVDVEDESGLEKKKEKKRGKAKGRLK